ncbi:MAG TPA: TonB-dependent receptor [Candidatus Krumholzibacteria bacterium]|nr:TonB-dependent receptor [Candidatus Krumholzibacteria bacterium]HRX50670.1 TonB-dependent receptor [Candidatus Krumholzibacteria bacterium]
MSTRWWTLLCLLCAGAALADEGWWTPFANDLPEAVRTLGPWAEVRDGEFGADLLWLHEPGASAPRLLHDGLPLGTGHRWADDPWAVAFAGVELAGTRTGGAGAFDAGGVLDLRSAPADTSGAVVDARFFKGDDQSYLRRVAFRTQDAPWVLRFDFDEQILYDDTLITGADPGPMPKFPNAPGDARDWPGTPAGEAKNRIVHMAFDRTLDDGTSLGLDYTRFRKHKTTVPVQDLERNDVRGERLHLNLQTPVGEGAVRVAVLNDGSDLVVDAYDADLQRTLEAVREAVVVQAYDVIPGWSLRGEAAAWRLDDSGAGQAWAGDRAAASSALGTEGEGSLTRRLDAGGWTVAPRAALGWTDAAGARPAAGVDLSRGPWTLSVERGGRAPRSDERATAWTVAGPTDLYRLLPDDALDWERTDRAAVAWTGRPRGWTLRADAVYRRTRDGIGWLPLATTTGDRTEHVGRWTNGLEIDGWAASLRADRRGRFHGLWQLEAVAALRGYDVSASVPDLRAVGLPPESSAALTGRWQHAYFQGDGILELAWTVEHRGAMADPWLPGAGHDLPRTLLHHAKLMFRLTGADLGLDIRNVLDQDVQVSAGTLSRGRELRWRLEWVLRR